MDSQSRRHPGRVAARALSAETIVDRIQAPIATYDAATFVRSSRAAAWIAEHIPAQVHEAGAVASAEVVAIHVQGILRPTTPQPKPAFPPKQLGALMLPPPSAR